MHLSPPTAPDDVGNEVLMSAIIEVDRQEPLVSSLDFEASGVELQALHLSILESNADANFYFAQSEPAAWPDWYVDVLSQLHALIRDSELCYLVSTISSDPVPAGRIVILTEKLVVTATVTASSGKVPEPATRIATWRRTELLGVAVEEIEPYPSNEASFSRA